MNDLVGIDAGGAPSGPRPAEVLIGLTLEDGWTIVSGVVGADDATGATFSVPYIVERESRGVAERAFLKALDIAKLVEQEIPIAQAISYGTAAYLHERDLVLRCSGRRMTNVVRGIAAGDAKAPLADVDPKYGALLDVPYIVFECADGDVRAAIERNGIFDEAWVLNVLHGVANGVRQLHQEGISHQDLKPSNVMTFPDVAKVGDLGRASDDAAGGLWSNEGINGDPTYAPPELLYGEMQPDERVRRRACDMYHVGSMAIFLMSGAGMTPLLSSELDDAFHWRSWPKSYRNALPFVRDAFDRALANVETTMSDPLRGELLQTVREMCDPDPLRRGSPKRTDIGRYSIDRYVSVFDRLRKKADMKLAKAVG